MAATTNYITHLNCFFDKLQNDNRFNTTHVSLYMALFHLWNQARFANDFFINRNEVMQLSRIGSKGTYHKCLHNLSDWKYIVYKPSYNPQIGSLIEICPLKFEKVTLKKNTTRNKLKPVSDNNYLNASTIKNYNEPL